MRLNFLDGAADLPRTDDVMDKESVRLACPAAIHDRLDQGSVRANLMMREAGRMNCLRFDWWARPNGTTALLDAVYFGLNQMDKAHNERRVLLIVSDGGDNHSRYNAREVLSAVSEAGVQIYAMGIFDEASRGKAEGIGPNLLGSITDSTGGETFPIHSLKDIRDIADRPAIKLRNQYLLAYHPSSLDDGKWHRISVRVTPPPNSPRLRVYAKMGYYAPAQ